LEEEISNVVSVSRIEMLPKCIGGVFTLLPVGSAAPDHTAPYGTVPSGTLSQALRAWLQSACPSGQKPFADRRASH
jgi:hypothetical protein